MTGQCVNGSELAVITSVTVTGSCSEGDIPCTGCDRVLGSVLLLWQLAVLDSVLPQWWRAVQVVHDSA